MNIVKVLITASLLTATAAFAATTPAAAPAATPAPATAPVVTPPAATAPARPDHHCRDQANEKHLYGAARASFIKKCRADAQPK